MGQWPNEIPTLESILSGFRDLAGLNLEIERVSRMAPSIQQYFQIIKTLQEIDIDILEPVGATWRGFYYE